MLPLTTLRRPFLSIIAITDWPVAILLQLLHGSLSTTTGVVDRNASLGITLPGFLKVKSHTTSAEERQQTATF